MPCHAELHWLQTQLLRLVTLRLPVELGTATSASSTASQQLMTSWAVPLQTLLHSHATCPALVPHNQASWHVADALAHGVHLLDAQQVRHTPFEQVLCSSRNGLLARLLNVSPSYEHVA